jgi:hypothetical protein
VNKLHLQELATSVGGVGTTSNTIVDTKLCLILVTL